MPNERLIQDIIASQGALKTSDRAVAYEVSVRTGGAINPYAPPTEAPVVTHSGASLGELISGALMDLADRFAEKGPPKPGVVEKTKTWHSIVALMAVLALLSGALILAR